MLGPAFVPELGFHRLVTAVLSTDDVEPGLNSGPHTGVHDAEVGYGLDNSFLTLVHAGDPPSAIRVLQVAHAIPNKLADIQFVPENTGAFLSVPTNCRISPGAAPRSWNLLSIKRLGDCDGAAPGYKHREDSLDHPTLVRMDEPVSTDSFPALVEGEDNRVSVRKSPSRLPGFDPSSKSSVGFGSMACCRFGGHRV